MTKPMSDENRTQSLRHRVGYLRPMLVGVTLLFSLVGCEVEQTREGKMPDVDVSGTPGKLPDVDVKPGTMPDVDVDAKGGQLPSYKVETPDVDVKMKEKTIKVPDVDVTTPAEKRGE